MQASQCISSCFPSMSSDYPNFRSMSNESLERHLKELKNEHSRRLTETMTKAQAELDALLKKYPELTEGSILRVALGKRQAQEAKRHIGHNQSVESINRVSIVQNIYPVGDDFRQPSQPQIQDTNEVNDSADAD